MQVPTEAAELFYELFAFYFILFLQLDDVATISTLIQNPAMFTTNGCNGALGTEGLRNRNSGANADKVSTTHHGRKVDELLDKHDR
jgi:hypothetical protein